MATSVSPGKAQPKGGAAQQEERAPSHVFQGLDRALPEAAPTSGHIFSGMRQQISIFISTEQERVGQQIVPEVPRSPWPVSRVGFLLPRGACPRVLPSLYVRPWVVQGPVPCSPLPGPERDHHSGLWLESLLALPRPWRGPEGTSFNLGGHGAREGVSKLSQNRMGCPERVSPCH